MMPAIMDSVEETGQGIPELGRILSSNWEESAADSFELIFKKNSLRKSLSEKSCSIYTLL